MDNSFSCAVCNTPCTKICSNCHKAYYCSIQHQKEDRRAHKPSCFPVKMSENLEFGRYLETTRDVSAGELLLVDEVLLKAPLHGSCLNGLYPLCLGCCVVLPGSFISCQKTCEKCRWPLCSNECPEINWHSSYECEIFAAKRLYPVGLKEVLHPTIYEAIHILRSFLLKTKDPVKWALLIDLKFNESQKDFESFIMIQYFIQFFCLINVSTTELKKLQKILITNGVDFRMSRIENGTPIIGITTCMGAILKYASRLTHSCIPNTKSTGKMVEKQGIRQQIPVKYASVDIKAGEMLTEIYGSEKTFFEGIVERRKSLFEQYHFWCKCERCRDPTELGTYTSAIKCKKYLNQVPCTGYYLPVDSLNVESPWRCDSTECKNVEKYENISQVLGKCQKELSSALKIKTMIGMLAEFSEMDLHENHAVLDKYLIKVIKAIFFNDLEENEKSDIFRDFEPLVKKCLECANKLMPGLTSYRGLLLFCLSEIYLENPRPNLTYLENISEGQKMLEECKDCLKCYEPTTEPGLIYSAIIKREKCKEGALSVDKITSALKKHNL